MEQKAKTARQEIKELLGQADDAFLDEFRHMANLTALRSQAGGGFSIGNWLRGPLLYALVRTNRPSNVLEFGTGRGYGTWSMAKGAADGRFACTIWSIDIRPLDAKLAWPIDCGDGPRIEWLSVREVWDRYLPMAVRERIRPLVGPVDMVMKKWDRSERPDFDLFFVDAGHDYLSVKTDLISALRSAAIGAAMIFDDFTDRDDYGVNRLLTRDFLPKLPTEAIDIVDMETDDEVRGHTVPHQMLVVRPGYLPDRALGVFFRPGAVRTHALRQRTVGQVRRLLNKIRRARLTRALRRRHLLT